jgi:nucleoside-diphosphate-sugar epimerase
MNVLVTGANGLLGHHVVMELLKKRHTVRIIVRSIENIFFDLSLIKVFTGSFTDYDCLKSAASGADAIIHIAAVTDPGLLHYEEYKKINTEATAQIIRIANELNINRFVYISTANTIGYGTKQQPADERFKIEFPFTESFYAQSKSASESLIAEASGKANRHMIIINPTFMLGKYDTKPGSGKLLLMGYQRSLMFIPKGGKNFVAAHDVAVAVCNAMTMGRNGERYLASGINLSFKEYYTLQKQVGEYEQKIIVIPDFLLTFIGKAGDIIRKFGIKTDLCSMNIRQLLIREYYSNQNAKTELNFQETELKGSIKEAIEWFRKTGKIN